MCLVSPAHQFSVYRTNWSLGGGSSALKFPLFVHTLSDWGLVECKPFQIRSCSLFQPGEHQQIEGSLWGRSELIRLTLLLIDNKHIPPLTCQCRCLLFQHLHLPESAPPVGSGRGLFHSSLPNFCVSCLQRVTSLDELCCCNQSFQTGVFGDISPLCFFLPHHTSTNKGCGGDAERSLFLEE